ncbi:phage baseplate assembly protein V [Corallococcus llansteffanensis]|uniref:Type IV secretion protein Rhs n=1 Tax=Corallococcus llansteffanensis TaxID=2316731 RepID=A0A3A8Q5C8_9BACT|nr:phage baseplate assembly protein V [Corallococcus llansteffanensis]RKH58494.1 type IV secretion protein Rhs [Corallococcus llansteffanensis]
MNSPWDLRTDERGASGLGGRFYGLYPAKVVDNQDPERQGRVKVALPWAPDAGSDRYEAWARVATLMAGSGRGTWFIPDQDDEVLVGFEAGDPRRPYVVGGLWNGKDAPPESMDAKNTKKVLHSRNGVVITLDDTDGQETLELKTPGGQTVTLKDGPGSVEVKDSNGNSVKLEASGVTVTASAKVTVNASTAEISAGMLTVNAGMSKFSGVVQADTVITNSVVSASYTPGAGNVW